MATLATESFTGTTGAAWGSQWTAGAANGSATIQANAGQLLPSGTGYKRVSRQLSGMATATLTEVYVEMTLKAVTEHYPVINVRSTTDTGAYPTGYFIQFYPPGNSWQILAGYGTGTYGNAASVTSTAVANHVYGIRLRAEGYVISAKVWDITAGATEPTSWQSTWTDTDSANPSGKVSLSIGSGNTTNPAVTFDNLTVTDGAVAGSTGTGNTSGSGAITAVPVPKFNRSTGRTGSGSVSSVAAPVFTVSGSTAGDGVTTGTTAQSFTRSGDTTGSGALTATAVRSVTVTGVVSGTGTAAASATPAFTGNGVRTGAGALLGAGNASFLVLTYLASTGVLNADASASFTADATTNGLGGLHTVTAPAFTAVRDHSGSGSLLTETRLSITTDGFTASTGVLTAALGVALPLRPRTYTVYGINSHASTFAPNSRTEVTR